MFGGATIAGLAYFQYQATRTFICEKLTPKNYMLMLYYRSWKLCNGYI